MWLYFGADRHNCLHVLVLSFAMSAAGGIRSPKKPVREQVEHKNAENQHPSAELGGLVKAKVFPDLGRRERGIVLAHRTLILKRVD